MFHAANVVTDITDLTRHLRTLSDDVVYQPQRKKTPTEQDLCSPKHISLSLHSVKGPYHSSCCICKRRGHKFVVVPSCVMLKSNLIFL